MWLSCGAGLSLGPRIDQLGWPERLQLIRDRLLCTCTPGYQIRRIRCSPHAQALMVLSLRLRAAALVILNRWSPRSW